MTGFRTLARNHDFTVLWIGQTVSELGSRMSVFVFPILGYQISGSALVAALVEATYLIGMALTLLPAGVLADRFHRGRLMRVASGSGVVLYGSLGAAGIAGHLTVPHLLVVGLLTGASAGVFAPAELSAVRTVVPNEQLPTALSQNQARQHLASLVGGPVGGALYGLARWLPFVVDAVTYAVSFVMLGRIRADLSPSTGSGTEGTSSGTEDTSSRTVRRDLAEGLHFVWHQRFLRVVLIWSAMVNLTINAIFFVAILRLLQGGFTAAEIGLADAGASICGVLGAIAAPSIINRFATGRLTVVIGWSWVPLLVPLMVWNNPAVMALALGTGLLLNPAGNAGIGAYRVAITPDRLQGRVSSTMQFTSWSTMPLAPVVGGALLGSLGGSAAIAVLAAATGAVALFVTLSTSVRAVPRPDAWVPAEAADRSLEPELSRAQ